MASQNTSLTIVYSAVYSGADQRKTSKLCVTGLCAGNSPVTGEFPAQMVSNAENVSIWWRHHEVLFPSSVSTRIRFTYVSSWDYVWLQQDVPVLWMMRLDVPDVGNGVYVKGELLMPDDRVREVSANNASTMSKIISLIYLSVIIICGSLLTLDVHNEQEKKVIVGFFHKQWLAKQAFILVHGQVITSI